MSKSSPPVCWSYLGTKPSALQKPSEWRPWRSSSVASNPVHEEAQGLLMRLLVQTGQRHLALQHYQALRAAV
jgi:hypothetical protein